ncbi:MAG: flagellar motor protein MotB [Gammaproteobacteria bacterium]|nr:flagellar motor protein MotB [Gammaproteobacteria bacterium]
MSDTAPARKCPTGLPPWLATFADLMALLMCFFVLLLSFSEMDVIKYKQVAGSMKEAFGVQRQIEAKIMPKGTSIIAQEFSPGKPQPTVINEMRQQTTDETRDHLDWSQSDLKEQGEGEHEKDEEPAPDAQQLFIQESLREEVHEGLIEIETEPGMTLIRIQEKGSFPSGRADVTPGFVPTMEKIAAVLAETRGNIYVAGHTDDIPIATARFRSNWELSAARSVTVVHNLIEYGNMAPERFLVEGHADAAPLASNDTPEGRALNRRVEIIVRTGADGAPEEAGGLPLPGPADAEDPIP